MNLVRIQFIISTAVYLLCVVVLPQYGFSGRVMQIYPCLAAGYFILFILYAEIIFLYYFNDLTGALLATLGFCLVTWAEACFLPAGVIFGTAWGWWRAALPALPLPISDSGSWSAIWMNISSAADSCLR